MALPSNVTFGTVVGTFLLATADSPDDPDRDPQGIAATELKFRFTPDLSVAVARDATATPPVMFALQDVPATVGTDGSLLGPDGAPGVRLVASTNPALEPSGWTWKVVLSGTGFPSMSFSFQLDPGATIDLSTVLRVPANPGSTLNAWLQAVADASAARDAAIAAAASVPSAASLAATYVALRGPWTAGTAFPKNSLVIQGGAVYLAAADVPARSSFTATDWQALGGTPVTSVTVTDNGDGTYSATGITVTDNNDGTYSSTGSVIDNGDGTFALAA